MPKKIGGAGRCRTAPSAKNKCFMVELYRTDYGFLPLKRALKPASSKICTPSSSAFAAFDPGASPTTTKSVFFDTDDAAFPPWAAITSLTPSRVKSTREPVTTSVKPARVCGAVFSFGISTSETPALPHSLIIALCQSIENHSITDSAIIPPTPSTSASASSGAS